MKKLALLLACCLITAVLAGCGTTPANQGKAEEVPTLVWYLPGDPLADLSRVNAAASEITKEKIGANIEMKLIDFGAYQERLNMSMASTPDFDLCFIGFLYPYQKAVGMGGLLEISKLLDENANDLTEKMPPYVKKAVTTDSGIYAVPNEQIMAFGSGRYIRSDLAAKYNFDLKAVKKLIDLEPILQVIKDSEPELVPTSRLNADSFRDDKGIHYISVNGSAVYLNDKTNKVLTYYQIPGAKESVKQSHNWYKKGFYRSDLATNISSGSGDSYYKAGRYAAVGTTFKPGVEGEIKAETGYDYTFVYNDEPVMSHTSPLETCIGVSRVTKQPEKAVKFINLINTDKELYNLICFGIEGKHYDKVSENRIKLKAESGYNPNAAWKFGNQFNAYLTGGQAEDSWTKTKEINDGSVKSPIIGIFFEVDDIRTEMTQIEKVQKEYIDARINTGLEDPGTYWDHYIAAMEKAGIGKVLELYQEQIDKFLK
jgi:putative aldouronate transport system substrate-binding protein